MSAKSTMRHLTKTVRNGVVAVGKRVPFVLEGTRSVVAKTRGRRFRALQRAGAPLRNLAVFEAYGGRNYACSPRALFEAMLADERFADFEYVWAFRAPIAKALAAAGFEVEGCDDRYEKTRPLEDLETVFGAEALDHLRRARIVVWSADRPYLAAYARAAYWITNFVLPTYLVPGDGQVYLQAWHGTPLKRLGCDITGGTNAMYATREIHERYRVEGARLSYLLSPSAYATEKFASAFALEETGRRDVIVEEGYPRNDLMHTFTESQAAEVRTRLGVEEGKRVLLYAPTWRDDQHSTGVGYTFEPPLDFDRLHAELGDEWVVLFRAHYLIASEFDFERYGGFVKDASSTNDINDLYIISDLLITDYSSVFFDYANLERPIIFYMYDLDKYAGEIRGFYLGLEELPGPVVQTYEDLVAAILSAEAPSAEQIERYDRFSERFTYLDDGRASQRVLRRVMPEMYSTDDDSGSFAEVAGP
jgi:CDP-glycerol glycerophosphotransferase